MGQAALAPAELEGRAAMPYLLVAAYGDEAVGATIVTEVGGSITDVRVVAAQDTQTLASLIAEQAVDLHAALVFVHDAGVGVRNLLIAMELKGALGRCNVVGFTPRVARRHSLSLDRVVDRMWKRACAERHPYGGCSR